MGWYISKEMGAGVVPNVTKGVLPADVRFTSDVVSCG